MLEGDKENANTGNLLVFSPPKSLKSRESVKAMNVSKEVPSIICAKFQLAMKIDFEHVEVGSFNSMRFLMINPNKDKAVKISVTKISTDKGFDILLGDSGSREAEIGPNGKLHGVVTWNPKVDMGVREQAVIKLDDKTPLQINITAKAGTGKATCKARPKLDRKALAAIAPRDLQSMKPKGKVAPVKKEVQVFEDMWAQQQAVQFTKWTNEIFARSDKPVVIIEGFADNENISGSDLQELREKRLQAHIKQRARLAYHHESMSLTLFKLGEEIDSGTVSMRADRDVHADIGLNKTFMELLFAYEMPYLKLGLETVFDEEITLSDGNETRTLKRFIQDHLLSDSAIMSMFNKTQLLLAENRNERRQRLRDHFVKKFLSLVLIIDTVRMKRLLGTSCLFKKNSGIKSSKQMIAKFCIEFLSSQGDFVKYLQSSFEYDVFFEQTLRDEFDYTVNNIMVDLRDGIRLARLAELLNDSEDVTVHLRTPAVSLTQKMHNVNLALHKFFDGLPEAGVDAKGIVHGNRESTLLLLWKLQYKFEQITPVEPHNVHVEACAVREEEQWRGTIVDAEVAQDLAVTAPYRDASGAEIYPSTVPFMDEDTIDANEDIVRAIALTDWCNAISGLYGLNVQDITESLADGRVLCLLMHYYHPTILPVTSIKKTYQNILEEHAGESEVQITNSDMQKAIDGEHKNHSTFKRACALLGGVPPMLQQYDSFHIPSTKEMVVFLSLLFARLAASATEVRAAVRIQRSFRHFITFELPRRRAIASQKKATAVKKIAASKYITKNDGVTDVSVTVFMSIHKYADVIKRRVRTFTARRGYLRRLESLRLEKEARIQEEERLEVERAERQARWERESLEALEREQQMLAEEEAAALAAKEAELQRIEEERLAAIAEEEYHRQQKEDVIEARIRAAEDKAREEVLAEAAAELERNRRALEETAKSVISEAEHDLMIKNEELRKEIQQRALLEEQLAELAEARENAEYEARRTEELRAELEERLAEEENLNENLTDQLESELRKREEADKQAKIDLEQQAALLKREMEDGVVQSLKSQRALELESLRQASEVERESLKQAEFTKRLNIQAKLEQEHLNALELKKKLQAEEEARLRLQKQLEEIEIEKAERAAQEEKFKLASVFIQTAWKKYAMKRQKAGVLIVSWFRKTTEAYLLKATRRSACKASACLASSKAAQEERDVRLYKASMRITKFFCGYRGLRRAQIMIYGFRRLAATRRAMAVRATSSTALKKICSQLNSIRARSNANIGAQTTNAIQVLNSCKQTEELLYACQRLRNTTEVSSECRSQLVQVSAPRTIFNMIRSCNRSSMHQDLLVHALNILLNVCRDNNLAIAVAKTPESSEVLMDVMQMFRDKKHIFCLSCKLLCRFVSSISETKQLYSTGEYRKRLDGILHIIERKHRLEARVSSVGLDARTQGSSPKETAPSGSPIDAIRNLLFLLD